MALYGVVRIDGWAWALWGLPLGVGGRLEPDRPCALSHASSKVAGDRLPP